MADFSQARRTVAEAAAARDRLTRELAATAGDLAAARAQRAAVRAAADPAAVAALDARIRALSESRATRARALSDLQETLRGALAGLLAPDLALEGDAPLVLLPVRVECRSTADGAGLRVRIFPDALHAEALDEGLSEAERAAGVAYWDAVWPTGDTTAPWSALAAAAGARRAAWVAEALRPKNLAARPGAAPDYPDTPPRSGRPAVARTLPDRFHVRVEQDGAAPLTVPGAAIPDELPVGLTDRDEFAALALDDDDLPPIDAALRWLVDYAEAERVGMAVTLALPVAGAPIRRLLVYGVRAALDPAAGAARLDRLVRAHRFTDGAQFLAQGTPTNNTDAARTDWSRRAEPGPPALAPPPAPAGANAHVLAQALGLDAPGLAALAGGLDAEQDRAAAFNAALWTTTWGDAIEHLTPAGRANGDARLDGPALDAVRRHWIDHVRGRGPLPAIRLGRQPYGVLPVVATGAAFRPLRGGFVEERLVPFIDQQIRWMWRDAAPDVATVMNRPLDVALPEILGTDAILRGLRVRTALSPDPVVKGAMALTLPDIGDDPSGQQVTKALLLLAGVADADLDDTDKLGTKSRALALPLVHETDQAFVAALLEPDPPRMRHESVLQVLLAHAASMEAHARGAVVAPEARGVLQEAIGATEADFDRELVRRALDAAFETPGADDGLLAKAAEEVTARVGRLDARALADRHPLAALAPATLAQQAAGAVPAFDRLRGPLGLQLAGELFHRSAWGAAFRSALGVIAGVDSLDERRALLAETLDCCSHRLDAWITATAARRLADLRAAGVRGAFLGAFGWLENIALRPPVDAGEIDGRPVLHDGGDGGYVHAPGLAHAATAGILRSGRLSHRSSDPEAGALDIDLSSTRVRDALTLLEGMRRGQSLGALLGYRLERRLHDRSGGGLELDRFVYVLRTLAPLRAGKLTEQGQPVEEGLAASDVVDGLRLMEVPEATIRAKLVAGPDDQRYIVPPDAWAPPRPGEAEAVLAAIAELERTHDAVADLLLAEAVHQLVSGNPARAAAALDALGAGEAPPPEPDVVRIPRSGVSIQHRLVLAIPDPLPPPVPGWRTATPRARAEPRLDRWAQHALGDPAAAPLAVGSDRTLAEAGFSALDVLYDADGDGVATSTLAARVRSAFPDLGDDLAPLEGMWERAGLLRAVLLTGRPLEAADLGAAVEAGATGRLPDTEELVARATEAAAALAAAAAAPDPLDRLAAFGVRAPAGASTLPLTGPEAAAARASLVAAASARAAEAESLLARIAPETPRRTAVELAGQALAAVFGGGFLALPLLRPPPEAEADLWRGGLGPGGVRARPGRDIRPWLQRLGLIRANVSAYGATILARTAEGAAPRLRVVQTPAAAFPTWVGLPFPEGRPPMAPLASTVVEIAGAAGDPEPDLTGALAGALLDEWTEVAPRRLERRDPADPEAAPRLVDVAATGLAVNANAPGARPPQAILVALSPDGGDWDADRLVAVLDETLALARMRGLTLPQIPYLGRYLPALYFRDWSLQGEPVIDWSKVAVEFRAEHTLSFLSGG